MCLIVFAYKTHPRYDLILAANRDEFYERPTRAAQFWDDHPDILAGKDLSAGGTWMGINRSGAFAALTNYRDPSITRENPPSRGQIPLNFLSGNTDPQSFLKELHHDASSYMGFNILTGTPDTLLHYSNIEEKINRVSPRVHGLSNHLLDTPWPKVVQAKKELQRLLNDNTLSKEALFEILKNDQPAAKRDLPDTGVPEELEKQISPIFIKMDGYGTRCSTLLLIGKDGTIDFTERRFKTGSDEIQGEQHFEISI